MGRPFAVGYQGGALKAPSAILGNGVSLSGKTLMVSRAGAVLDGVDLRGYTVEVHANNVTIKNSLFNATGFHTIYQTGSASGLVVEYNTFDGQKANNSNSDYIYSDKGASTIRNNEFFNLPSDAINTVGGTHREELLLRRRLPDAAPMPTRSRSTAPPGRSSSARTTSTIARRPTRRCPTPMRRSRSCRMFGNINDVRVDGNVLLGGGYTIYAMNAEHAAANIKITNNDIGLGHWGDLYPASKPANFVYSGNDRTFRPSGQLDGQCGAVSRRQPTPPAAHSCPSATAAPALCATLRPPPAR